MIINSDLAHRMNAQAETLVEETVDAAKRITAALGDGEASEAIELSTILGLRHEARTVVRNLSTIAKLCETVDRLNLESGAYGRAGPRRIKGPKGDIVLSAGSDEELSAMVAALNRMHLASYSEPNARQDAA